ncbi:hypothetical protein ACFL2X_01075 [Candidatus Latescibacterota bacterium]
MIRIEILTVFLTMPLSVAIMQFISAPSESNCYVFVFIYFVVNCIRFFQGDVNVIEDLSGKQKEDIATSHNAFSFFVGIAAKFSFLLTAYHLNILTAFFAFNGLAYLFDIFWLFVLKRTIDIEKPRGKELNDTFKRWLCLDVIEGIISLTMSIAIYKFSDDPNLKEYLEFGTIGVLSLLLLLDYLINQGHYFDRRQETA